MKLFFLLFSVFLLTSCPTSVVITDPICDVEVPTENLVWLKEIKEDFEQSTGATKKKIILYKYNNENVFLVDICSSCADNLTTVYNCTGNVICEFGGIAGVNNCPDFEQNAIKIAVLWEN